MSHSDLDSVNLNLLLPGLLEVPTMLDIFMNLQAQLPFSVFSVKCESYARLSFRQDKRDWQPIPKHPPEVFSGPKV